MTIEPGPRPVLDPAGVSGSAEPALHHRTLRIPPGWARHAIRTLAAAAAESDRRITPALELEDESRWPGLLAATLSDNREAMVAFAAELGAPVDVVTTLAGYAATALLHRLPLTAHPSPLTSGCCPTCGAWPLLAELRGIEQDYRLRCGRCGSDWAGEWLRCTFCGERDHAHLGSLIPETGPGSATVRHCATCRQYLKAIPVLAPSEPFELLLRDLETVQLDLAARERGFSGPPELGFALEVAVSEEVPPRLAARPNPE